MTRRPAVLLALLALLLVYSASVVVAVLAYRAGHVRTYGVASWFGGLTFWPIAAAILGTIVAAHRRRKVSG